MRTKVGITRLTIRPLAALIAIAAALVAAATFTVVAATGDVGPKFPRNPWANKSDAERQADVDAAHERNDDYLRGFVASGRDPRDLPVLWIPSYAAPLPSLRSSVAAADVILRGVVADTAFEVNPSGGMPIALSAVRVSTVAKGTASPEMIVLRQSGGPVAQEIDGALVQLDTGELILPGDDVVLFLQRVDDAQFRAQAGTGVYFIRSGLTYPEAANPFADEVAYRKVTDVIALIQQLEY